MSGHKNNKSIWNTDLNEYGYRASFIGGRRSFRRRNADRDLREVLIYGALILIVLISAIGISSRGPEISKSTKSRDKISPTINTPASYIDDQAEFIDDRGAAESAMSSFFGKTGVAPYIVIVNNSAFEKDKAYSTKSLSEAAYTMYDKLFDDGDHMLILMLRLDDDSFKYVIHVGSNASHFMDEEAKTIVIDCLEHYIYKQKQEVRYANDKLQGGNAIADAFDDASDRLMHKDMSVLVIIGLIAGGSVVLILIFRYVRKRRRKGGLVIEKEYLPGEYVPPSVVRISDTENAKKGIKYNYGSEGVSGDIPMGTLLTHDMLHPQMESAVMPSAAYPGGVLLNNRKNGALMPDVEMPSVEKPFNDFVRRQEKTDESEFLSSGSVSYRDNKGNTVYMNKEDDMKAQFNNWAQDYASQNGESAFKDESGGTPVSTSVYHDNKGGSVLLKGENKPADTQSQIDKWASYYASVRNDSSSPLLNEEKKDNWLDDTISSENDKNSSLFHL